MKYPNPTFMNKAYNIRNKRRLIVIIIVTSLLVVTTTLLFIFKVSKSQELYAEKYPDLVGKAKSDEDIFAFLDNEVIEPSETSSVVTKTSETTENSETSETSNTSETDTSETSTKSTKQNNSADEFQEIDNVYLKNSHPLQILTHEEREVKLNQTRDKISDLSASHQFNRICVEYYNLANGESMEINSTTPIVPSGAYALPIELAFYETVANDFSKLDDTVTYKGEAAPGNSSYIAANYSKGKNFYLRTIANLAITQNDNLAKKYLIDYMGGIDEIMPQIKDISSIIDYQEKILFKVIKPAENSGGSPSLAYTKAKYLSSCYDMTKYASTLYYRYINNSSLYQGIMNDLSTVNKNNGIDSALATLGHEPVKFTFFGRNNSLNSYFDMEIIDDVEPYIITIYSECNSEKEAFSFENQITSSILEYINSCH